MQQAKVPVRRTLFAWHGLAPTPTAKLRAIEVPKSEKFGGNHRLVHGCGNIRADYLPPDYLCRHLLLHVQATGAFPKCDGTVCET
jgi:hypothetical protein